MKKIVSILFLVALFATNLIAQSTSPRWGSGPPTNDNTGRVLTYSYLPVAVTSTAVTVSPKTYNTTCVVATGTISPTITFTNTGAYAGDVVTIITTAAASNTVTLAGTQLHTASTYTLASGKQFVITFIYDGTNYNEVSRSQEQ